MFLVEECVISFCGVLWLINFFLLFVGELVGIIGKKIWGVVV